MSAPKPPTEDARLATLTSYRILDSASEQAFDDLTRLAAAICESPIAAISLVDAERQWFKARVGLAATETSRDLAFCAHAILGTDVLVVEDAQRDERFADNPLVTSDPRIRFYAGAPLTAQDGHAIGTLCVIDQQPRRITEQQLAALVTLRNAVVTQLELRRAILDLEYLASVVPICAWCRSVQTDDGQWQSLHAYVAKTTPLSHGICPSCTPTITARAGR